ncbi:MAG TPA: hypothetical protein VF244_11180 [Acidimicrobiales bacterium]
MNTEHPPFDDLSAYFDGEAPELEAHVAACPECRRTVRWLGMTADLVATPVPPLADDAKEAALARALGTPGSTSKIVEAIEVPVPAASRVAPVRPAPVVPIETARSRRRGGSGMWVGIGSVAAVLLAFVVGVGVLTGGNGGDGDTTVAAGSSQERAADGFGTVGASIADAGGGDSGLSAYGDTAAAGGVDGGNLGDIADATALAAAARPTLAARQAEVATRDVAPTAGVAPGPGVPTGEPDLTPKVVGTRPCELEARAARPGMGTVVYFATARVGGVPVVVLGFESGTTQAPITLLALAQQEGCRVVLEAAGP